MRLLRVIASMNPAHGGPCEGIRKAVPILSTMGCDNEVVCLDESEAEFLRGDAFPVHAIGSGRSPWAYHSELGPWLLRNLPRFDAAILHGIWLYPGLALRRAALRCDRPYFVFPHGMLDPWFQRDADRRLKALRNWIYWQLVEHGVIRDAQGLLFTCEVEKGLARHTFRPYKPRAEISVGYGVSEPPVRTERMKAEFFKRCAGLAPNRSYFLFLGRIHPKKGVDLLIQAFANIFVENKTLASDDLPQLVIAGSTEDSDYGLKVQKLATELCPPNCVLWPGMLQGEAKWGAIYGSEAFILPSHQENFGIAVAEALVCGVPVLISDKVNIWPEIDANRAGYVEPDTLVGTEALLQRWLRLDHQQKSEMRTNARRCFLEKFELGKAAESLIRALQFSLARPA
jgi:glycosyltransferase involved in cell wall biosynthesis